jgi:hypothetical protein
MQKHLARGVTLRSGGGIAEQRSDRFYFADYTGIADEASWRAPERRRAIVTDTFRVVQMAQVSSAKAAVTALAARLAAGGGSRTAVIRERQDLVQQWQQLDSTLIKALSRVPAARRPAEESSLRAAPKDATRRLDDLDTRIAAEFPDNAELSNPQPLPASEAQALLATDETLLAYLVPNETTWLWVLRRDNLASYHIEIGAKALAEEVRVLRAQLNPDFNRNFLPFPAARAYALYHKIVRPADPAARWSSPSADCAGRGLAEPAARGSGNSPARTRPPIPRRPSRYQVARPRLCGGGTTLRVLSSEPAPVYSSEHASAPFLGVGNPVLKGSPIDREATLVSVFPGAIADADMVRALAPLPETATELRAIAQAMGASDDDLLLVSAPASRWYGRPRLTIIGSSRLPPTG